MGLDLGKRLGGGHVRHHASFASPWISCMGSRPSSSSFLTFLRVWASRGIGPYPRTSRLPRTPFRLTQCNLRFEPYHRGDWLYIHLFRKKMQFIRIGRKDLVIRKISSWRTWFMKWVVAINFGIICGSLCGNFISCIFSNKYLRRLFAKSCGFFWSGK